MTTFSIIIPAHNEENYIGRTLQSIINQLYQDYEVIVVSNGCTDKTEEIVKKRTNSKLKHFSLAKANVSLARNYGAEKAEGNILLFLDADTLLRNDSLLKIRRYFTEKYSVATTKSKPDSKYLKYHLALGFKNFYNSTGLYQGCSGALICRKEDFFNVGGYSPSIIVKEHRKLTIKLKRKTGKKFRCIDTYTITSMRRFRKWGLIKAIVFWIVQFAKNYFGDLKKSDYEKVR